MEKKLAIITLAYILKSKACVWLKILWVLFWVAQVLSSTYLFPFVETARFEYVLNSRTYILGPKTF